MTSPRVFAIATSLVLTACTDPQSELEALDDEAAAADGKADGLTIMRLERATPAEVTTSFVDVRGPELTACFDAYRMQIDPAATTLTKAIADDFIDVAIATNDGACDDWYDLSVIVKGVLDAQGLTEATPTQIIAKLPAWAKPQLESASLEGFVQDKDLPLLFYTDLMRVRDANAMAREKHPTGVDLAAIRAQWREVRNDTTLDRAYLNPVTFAPGALDGNLVFKNLRAAFPLRGLTLQSTGFTAVNEFAAAHEGPDGDPAFKPIATALKKSSIRKRFFYGAYNSEWSSNVLIVVDQHGQAYGMQMGYTE